MRLAQFEMVHRHVDARRALLRQIDALASVYVTIDGVHLDEAVEALIRPVIAGELRARVRQIDLDLEQLGVRID